MLCFSEKEISRKFRRIVNKSSRRLLNSEIILYLHIFHLTQYFQGNQSFNHTVRRVWELKGRLLQDTITIRLTLCDLVF